MVLEIAKYWNILDFPIPNRYTKRCPIATWDGVGLREAPLQSDRKEKK